LKSIQDRIIEYKNWRKAIEVIPSFWYTIMGIISFLYLYNNWYTVGGFLQFVLSFIIGKSFMTVAHREGHQEGYLDGYEQACGDSLPDFDE
jgi:hypothetical protein